ncbi:MAG: PIG-L family deacetylase [Chloroflexi bacterium]|nr:PIG-L family deacetylase [Chloroflexota bacterium]MDA1226583.1 PIG-L family deacetylase [Chloroflexota bacterium]
MSQENRPGLLAIFAHPDDESAATGGTLAHYAKLGFQVGLVCATRGEIGEISDPNLASQANLGEVREQELRDAAAALGVADLTLLDYRDSGMAGTADNEHPNALTNALADDVVAALVGIIRQRKPGVVITFDPNGGYGHPDHIAIHHHTVEAFTAAADVSRYKDKGAPWSASRLFYTVFTKGTFATMREGLEKFGADSSEMDEWESVAQLWDDNDVHVRMDLSGVADAKWEALNAHRTQFGENNIFSRIPVEDAKAAMSSETFVLALPVPAPGTILADLFDGI